MKVLLTLLVAAAPVRAAQRVATVSLPAAPLALSAGAPFAAPAGFSRAVLPGFDGAVSPALLTAAAAPVSVAPALPVPRASAPAAASAVLAGRSASPAADAPRAAGHVPALAHARDIAGLMTAETGRGPPELASFPAGKETGVVLVPDVDAALAALRAASFERHRDTDALVERLAALHPELPLSPERLFIVRDAKALERYGVPEPAAGAARILSDGRREAKVVILLAPRGLGLDDFVEYSIHEAVHLRDEAILRVPHERFVEHWLAEGWTQLRAHDLANASLKALGRPERANPAYSKEVALARAFAAHYGEAPLRELVERGSAAGVARALGSRWDGLLSLAAEDEGGTLRQRDWFLQLMLVVVEHPEFGPLDFRRASRALHGARPS